MKIKKVKEKVLQICESEEMPYKENKQTLIDLFDDLDNIRVNKPNKLQVLLALLRELANIKNRKAAFFEERTYRMKLSNLAFSIRMNDDDAPEDVIEELSENYADNARPAIKMNSELLKYAKEIIAGPEDKSKRYKKQVAMAMMILNDLQEFYLIPDVKEIFQSKAEDKDEDLQQAALNGLEIYYATEDAGEMTEAEQEKVEKIIKSTKNRSIASTCCQVLINAEKIGDLGAIMRMDGWKDRNYR